MHCFFQIYPAVSLNIYEPQNMFTRSIMIASLNYFRSTCRIGIPNNPIFSWLEARFGRIDRKGSKWWPARNDSAKFKAKQLALAVSWTRVTPLLIQPGIPTNNPSIESFNGKLRDGRLKEYQFCSLHRTNWGPALGQETTNGESHIRRTLPVSYGHCGQPNTGP